MNKSPFAPSQDLEGVTTSYVASADATGLPDNATTFFDTLNPIQHYFTVERAGLAEALAMVEAASPSVSEVITCAWNYPGVEVRDRAIELLSERIPDTLQFARRFQEHDFFPRPFFTNKTWDIVISALGLADEVYAPHCKTWIEAQLHSPNLAKRLAAFDALEALEVDC